ncbi:ABC transporter permease [Bosea sp. R86505]|uniref:ABC transporter permease n=1 Tax=Bosea sp. R86505 TaxID=3101710 RepID=UPI00366E8C19
MGAVADTGLLAVARREVSWIWRDKVALILLFVIPLMSFAVLATTFSAAVIRELKIDVVDLDNSATSLALVETIAASPSVRVAHRSNDLTGAMTSIRSGQAIAAVYLPRDFERDILAGKRPQAVIFANKQFLTPGNVAASGLQVALSNAVANLPKGSAASAGDAPGALVVEQFVLTNPGLNYAQFLLRSILPTILHVLIACAAGYAVGSEFSQRDMRGWLATAGGSPLTALTGKLLPYAAIFLLMMMVGLVIIHGLFGVPFRGDPVMVAAAACLLIVGYLSLGALLPLLVKSLPSGLVLTGVLCSPAFGFAGVGYPILAMNDFSVAWGAILPLRWYIEVLFDQAARGVPVGTSAIAFTALATLALFYGGLAWMRLRALARQPFAAAPEPRLSRATARTRLVRGFMGEFLRVMRDRGVFGLIILGPLIYGFLYPQPYATQLMRNVPIAVVDQDGSELGRTIVQALSAHEGVSVAMRGATLAEAEAAMARGEVYGVVAIPANAQRELIRGERVAIPAYVDSAYLLIYSRVTQSILEAVGTVSAEIASRGARSDGSLYRQALVTNAPVEVVSQPLFNPTGGYGSYAVPAAFVLILQQTLLMGAAMLGGLAFLTGRAASRRARLQPGAVLGQALAHLLLVLPGFALYLIVLPRFYGFSQQGRVLDLIVFSIPFILAVSFLGQFVGAFFRRRETSVLLLISVSLPLFFLVGVAWPPEAIPGGLRMASLVIPSTTAIDGLVRINQMGASFADVHRDWLVLWGLACLYAVLAMLSPLLMPKRAIADER